MKSVKSASDRKVLQAPFLRSIRWKEGLPRSADYPFSLPILKDPDFELAFTKAVTILVGENATGKSTLLEAIAQLASFHVGGGNRNFAYRGPNAEPSDLALHLRAAWLPKVTEGFFFRADAFINTAAYIDEVAGLYAPGRPQHDQRKLHQLSHGESFLALFENKLKAGRQALYLLDEPESALSPSRQLRLMRLINGWARSGKAQIILATHAPLLMAQPGATLLYLSNAGIREVNFRATPHFAILARFFADPDAMVEAAMAEDPGDPEPHLI